MPARPALPAVAPASRPRRPRRRTTAAAAAAAALLVGYLISVSFGAHAAATLLSQGKPATASSTENAAFPASAAVDGDTGTRWASTFSDPQWLQVDLGAPATVCQVTLAWEAAYATAFQIQISADAGAWSSVYATTTGAGGTQTLTVAGTGRYLRLYTTARATQYGVSLWEFAVATVGGGSQSPTPTPSTPAPGTCPWVNSTAPVADRVTQLMAAMTLDQKLAVLHGNGAASPYIGNLTGIPALCIPNLGLQDGPVGVGDGMGGVTQLPSANAMAATFDPSLNQQMGAVAGAEFAGKGVTVALGPTLNIVRDPRWGRAFETYSEDPYLTAQMAVANIRGIQSQGVMAQAKHAAVYNQETNRNGAGANAVVDTRTLQEIYLPGFQASVSAGAAASVMCGYNPVNGVHPCQNPYLLNTALYQQAGFGGFVTSDWGAMHSTVESANAGMTMEMPGGYFYGDFLKQAIAAGTVTQATVDTMVRRVLTQMFAFGLFDKAASGSPTATVTTAAHVATALAGAQEGTVLLKNTGVLPLSTAAIKSIAVLGVDGGAGVQSIGGGSATVTSSGTVWPLTGIQNRVAGTGVTVQYAEGKDAAGVTAAADLAGRSDVAVVFASNNYGNEGSDQATIDLPGVQNQLITAVAAANPRTIVVLHTNSATTMPWLGQVAAVLEGFYSGQQVGAAVASLLFGDVSPSGKLPVTFPASLADVPAATAAQWPGDATNGVQYSEGLKVGYRWYDAQGRTPLFPFGFGLSYTTFAFSNLTVGGFSGNQATVTATVTNTGTRTGTEVVQLYTGAPAALGEPVRQLKGFQRVTLAAGASQTVSFPVTAHALAHWDTATSAWVTTGGAYQVSVGNSSRNLPLSGTVTVPTTVTGAAAGPLAGAATAASAALAATTTAGTGSAATTTAGTGSAAAAGSGSGAGSAAAAGAPAGTVEVPNPHGMTSRVGAKVHWVFAPAQAGVTYRALDMPGGLTISPSGVISGAAAARGTSTVTVIATGAGGETGSATFVWTVT